MNIRIHGSMPRKPDVLGLKIDVELYLSGSIVFKIRYDKKNHRVYINTDQYFDGIAEDIYQYRIGGYQVCHKWLKDRKGRTLSLNDVKHYCRIATVIEKTIEIQNKIGGIYDKIENELINF